MKNKTEHPLGRGWRHEPDARHPFRVDDHFGLVGYVTPTIAGRINAQHPGYGDGYDVASLDCRSSTAAQEHAERVERTERLHGRGEA
jgi:hypothetical protein